MTTREIARECGVSQSTVAAVINNRKNIGKETRKKVLDLIEKLNYNPVNNLPRVKRIKSQTLALIIPNVNYLVSPFYNRAIKSFFKSAVDNYRQFKLLNYDVIDRQIKERTNQIEYYQDCGGVIFFAPFSDEWEGSFKYFHQQGVPCVSIGRKIQSGILATIDHNDREGLIAALEHLYAGGHRRIGYINRASRKETDHRHQVYLKFMQDKGLKADNRFNYMPTEITTLQEWAKDFSGWLKGIKGQPECPTAYFCFDDRLAVQVLTEMRVAGIRVPEDISVIGFDNNDISLQAIPPLTTVSVPVEQMCEMACQLLINCIDGKTPMDSNMKIVMETKLVIRESTAKAVS